MTDQAPPLRPAATVILVRDDGAVLLIRRAKSMGFFGDAFAFPGGRVDAGDVEHASQLLGASGAVMATPYWQDHHFAPAVVTGLESQDTLALAYARAAQREAEEEVGLLVPLGSLLPWARWMTPLAEGKRFDTLFFVAPLPSGDIRLNEESSEYRLLKPAEALSLFAADQLRLPPPTLVVLAELAERAQWTQIAEAARVPIPEVLPTLFVEGESTFILLPGDPGNPSKPHRPWPHPITPRLRLDGWPPKFTFLPTPE